MRITLRVIVLVVAAFALSTSVAAQTLTESIHIALVKDGVPVSEHDSWEACQFEARRLAQLDPRISGIVIYTCQSETRRVAADYTPPVVEVPTLYVEFVRTKG